MISFTHSYSQLPERFYQKVRPTPSSEPTLVLKNDKLLHELQIDLNELSDKEIAQIFSGNKLVENCVPIALAYAGHQFGHFTPKLGDGRAILLGEVIDTKGRTREVQLKGAGRTEFSRQGDGRAALGPVIREYLVSEAMNSLGIPTTRSLAMVLSGDRVHRERDLPGAILTRVAGSHIRIGTFEYFAFRKDWEAVKLLADYAIDRHFPSARDISNPYLGFLEAAVKAQAHLVARWMLVGFIHGVMNTDNMAISGETIDYGPCAYMDFYDPNMVFSSIDHQGRYAFSNQPAIAQWNLGMFATCLLPFIDANEMKAMDLAKEVIHSFGEIFRSYWLAGMREKLGFDNSQNNDFSLIETLLNLMHKDRADYTLTFRCLADCHDENSDLTQIYSHFSSKSEVDTWIKSWRDRLRKNKDLHADVKSSIQRVSPAIIPRNHQIERLINSAIEGGDFTPMKQLIDALSSPYENPSKTIQSYMLPPGPDEQVIETFCGT
ncbi:MAG: YdiU family protein [Bdellovibrionales bacterium]|nr:YdiU family protein [Bdellovibrionales bacterium]